MDKMFTEADIDYKSFNDGERSFVAFASKPVIDRDREIISWNAWDLANYRRNSVVLWAHDYRKWPVARSMWIRAMQEGLKFKPAFADTEEGNEIYQLYKEKMLNAFSVGFIPRKWHDPGEEDDDETRDVATDEKARKPLPRRIYDKVELLEISCVPVPACPDALVEAFKEGKIKTKGLIEYIEEHMPELPMSETKLEHDVADLLEYINSVSDLSDDDPAKITLEHLGGEPFDPQKPYPNEHACRLNDPGKYDRLRRNNCFRRSDGKCVDYIFGIKERKSEVQALRYKKDVWTAGAARSHCKNAGGTFEAASSSAEPDPDSATTSDSLVDEDVDKLGVDEGVVYGEWEEDDAKTEIEISEEELDELAKQLAERSSRNQALGSISDEIAELKARIKVLRGGVG